MRRHILILGNNLAGLVTAHRLLQYGFHISIADTPFPARPRDSSRTAPESVESTAFPLLSKSKKIPLIFHGFYHATWALSQELLVDWPPQTFQEVQIEFGAAEKTPIGLPKSSRLTWLHPLTRLASFKGLSWSDRWNILNVLEKKWEDNDLLHSHSDTENVETWLVAAKQSEHSRYHFWNPLCYFFLNCDLSQASLNSFIKVISQYWFGQTTDASTFLAPPDTLDKLEASIRQFLSKKGAQFHISHSTITIQTDTEGIRAIELDSKHVKAESYISTLRPHKLLPLLPERALARYTYFSSLVHIPEMYGLAVQFILHDSLIGHRLILSSDHFNWITSQPISQSGSEKTVVTCITLRESIAQEHSEKELIQVAWTVIQKLFNLASTMKPESCEPQIIRQAGTFFPSLRGSRAHRPISQTPLSNFFLAGPWTATHLSASLDSTIQSANTCAEAVATAFYRI